MSRLWFAFALGLGLLAANAFAQTDKPAVPTQSFGSEDAGAPPSPAAGDAAPPETAAPPAQTAAPPPPVAEPVPTNPYPRPPTEHPQPPTEPVPANPYDGPSRTAQPWRSRYDWSLGAGFGLGSFAFLGTFEGQTTTPTYLASIERRVGPKTWLVLNAVFRNDVTDVELVSNIPPFGRRTIERSSNAIGGLIGLRHALVSSLVEVSLFATAGATYEWIGGPSPGVDESYGNYSTLPGTNSKAFQALGGLAVERELIEALAIRLSTSILELHASQDSVVRLPDETPTRNGASAGVRLELSPVLDLRFYF